MIRAFNHQIKHAHQGMEFYSLQASLRKNALVCNCAHNQKFLAFSGRSYLPCERQSAREQPQGLSIWPSWDGASGFLQEAAHSPTHSPPFTTACLLMPWPPRTDQSAQFIPQEEVIILLPFQICFHSLQTHRQVGSMRPTLEHYC